MGGSAKCKPNTINSIKLEIISINCKINIPV